MLRKVMYVAAPHVIMSAITNTMPRMLDKSRSNFLFIARITSPCHFIRGCFILVDFNLRNLSVMQINNTICHATNDDVVGN